MKAVKFADNSDKIFITKSILNIIIDYLNYNELIKTLEGHHRGLNNHRLIGIYNKLVLLYDIDVKKDNEFIDKSIDIKSIPILLNPWNKDRVYDNLERFIRNDTKFDWRKSNGNIMNIYLHPMDIIICGGGNHSQLTARIKGEGETSITEVKDYSKLYKKVHFNGENYLDKDNKIIDLEENKDDIFFYSGVIFELGRFLLDQDED